ncbi:pimeloyl-ACP methyl ester carboxylesterase [Nocardiopsis sp. Huas11]|uniref:alpha/beta fold hydrolase n=1 Tax=Nocardiopsis sp. Huas11 TaxID=2183912 RepID=UPI000EAD0E41|nr:alpha/beta hydrolase [Nocardiopsis sp. Huas11]RKS04447.1 pimeloyl-ACP methyl ester carboxylesterase [Nocardiopsis sp. Huas11]
MRHLDRPQGRIAYDLFGDGNDGALVVCVPGMFDHRASFRCVAERLADAGHRVAVMDLRGHGDSDTTFGTYTNRAAATDAIALAEELGGRDVVMVGNSFGGAAVTMAAMERPDLVAGIALLSPFLRVAPTGPAMHLLQRLLVSRPWAPWTVAAFYDSLHKGRTPRNHREQKARIVAMLRPADRLRAVRETIFGPNEQVLAAPGLTARAVVMVGELDPDWPDPRAEAEWAASVIGGTVEMVPESGHYAQSQRPDVVATGVLRLIARVGADA